MRTRRPAKKRPGKPRPRKSSHTRISHSFPIVGMEAGAGGLEAFERLLRNLPGDTGMAFILLRHLDPKHESRLAEILARAAGSPLILAPMRDVPQRQQPDEQLLATAILKDRARLARDIHDTLAQSLAGIVFQLEGADQVLRHDPDAARQYIAEALKQARAGMAEARRSILALQPSAAENLLGVIKLFAEEFIRGTATTVECSIKGEPRRLAPGAEENLYRIAQEALRNAVTHGKAAEVRVRLIYKADGVRLVVADNGKGFSSRAPRRWGLGLFIMEERAKEIGGELTVRSGRGEGTRVEISVPSPRDMRPPAA